MSSFLKKWINIMGDMGKKKKTETEVRWKFFFKLAHLNIWNEFLPIGYPMMAFLVDAACLYRQGRKI